MEGRLGAGDMRLIALAITLLAVAVLVVGWRATHTVNVNLPSRPACTNPFGC